MEGEEQEEMVAVGGCAYHGKFCFSDWGAEREPSSIMYMMDP